MRRPHVIGSMLLLLALMVAYIVRDPNQPSPAGTATPISPQATLTTPAAGSPPAPTTPTRAPAVQTATAGQSAMPPTDFLRQIAAALDRNDVGAIVQMTRETEVDCRTSCPGMPCDPSQCGQVRRGVLIGPWASEYSLVSRQDVHGTLARFYATPQSQMRDHYGSGVLRLFGIGTGNGQIFDAITTLIQQDGRRLVLLRLGQTEGVWHIASMVHVGLGPFVDAILGSQGGYRIVQPWL